MHPLERQVVRSSLGERGAFTGTKNEENGNGMKKIIRTIDRVHYVYIRFTTMLYDHIDYV